MTSNLAQVLKVKKMARRIGKLSTTEQAKLEKMYTSGPAAYGSARNLQATSKMPKAKIDTFLQQKDAHTKYRQIQRKFPRLKVIAYEINEIWSIDVAYVDKLAKYNNGVKYLLVAVDVLSRFLRVVPMRSKSAPDAAKAFEKMIEKVQPQKVWSDKGTEFKGAFKNLCDKRGIATYTTASETKSAFAERNIRSLKNIMYKHMENKWTYHYISKLSQFVSTINSRVNRVTKLAPNKVTKKHEQHLRSLAAEQSSKFVKKPKFNLRDKVRIAKQDLPFKKGYKQSFTDEIFTIIKIFTFNPPTYNLRNESGDTINGKFYEPELVKVNGRIWHLPGISRFHEYIQWQHNGSVS